MSGSLLPRILAGLVAFMGLTSALGWIVDPASAAANLGMPLLEGLGRSTQVGDFTAFFMAAGVFCVLGAWQLHRVWLWAAAIMFGGAAIFRTLAWIAHGAEFATTFVIVEIVLAGMLLIASARIPAADR